MSIQWPFLLLSVVLLAPPLPWSASLRRYVMSPRRNASARVGAMIQCWQNWVDLLRAGVGAYLLANVALVIDSQVKGAGTKALLLQAAVLTPALLLQMVRTGREIQLIAPVFYLCGIAVVLPGYLQGGFAAFVGWLFAIGGRRPAYQLPIMAFALAVVGCVLDFTITLPLALAGGLIFLPVLLEFLFQRPLAFVARDRASAQSESASENEPASSSSQVR